LVISIELSQNAPPPRALGFQIARDVPAKFLFKISSLAEAWGKDGDAINSKCTIYIYIRH
jgi:hypothetical protein